MATFFDYKQKVINSLSKNIPRIVEGLQRGPPYDSRTQRAARKVCLGLEVVAAIFLRSKREKKRNHPEPKTTASVNAFLDFLTGPFSVDVPEFLLANLAFFTEKTRQDIYQITYFINRHERTREPFANKLVSPDGKIMANLINGFNHADVGRKVYEILSELIRQKIVAKRVLYTDALLDPFFGYMKTQEFEITANAFEILTVLLTKFPDMAKTFLDEKYTSFIAKYDTLINVNPSKYYVTLRQALQLLSDLLLTRENYNFMIKFIGSEEQLRLILTQLFGKTPTVRVEAFHIFKVFVLNPRKTEAVHTLLFSSKDRILKFMSEFKGVPGQEPNEVFISDKQLVVKKLRKLVSYEEWRARRAAKKAAKEKKRAEDEARRKKRQAEKEKTP